MLDMIDILGVKYNIRQFEAHSRDDQAMGRSDTITCEIGINKSLPCDARDVTFLHEIIHVISGQLCLDLNEMQVTALATGLFCVLTTNNLDIFDSDIKE